jgi:peptide chain release factor 2
LSGADWSKDSIDLNQRLSIVSQDIENLKKLKQDIEDIKILEETEDVSSFKLDIVKKIDKLEEETFLSGKYDKNNAILTIHSGAGGKDSQDWSTILLRMYQRYSERNNFSYKILDQSFGEPGPEGRIGTKEVTLEIKGKNVYGMLKRETGVHRLVRISPFSAKQLRHTSFSSVEVIPEIKEDDKDIEIKEEDIKVDTFRSSGPGGQNVNKRETAIRILHISSKIVVSCQTERTQGLNKHKALNILKAKLAVLEEEKREKELKNIKGESSKNEWGSQIRSYVFYPYQMVKDNRTKVETSQLQDVLDGNLDEFIRAQVQI